MIRKPAIVLAAAALMAANAPARSTDPVDLTVHEWGTFTSVAGADGTAVEWLPQSGPADLPSFVGRVRHTTKGCLAGTVRMETPVLYFYAPQETSVDVAVRFPQGIVTEWYPTAVVSPRFVNHSTLSGARVAGSARWNGVTVIPRAAVDFPDDRQPSHYYAARETDASPLRVGRQTEKFLFYRGVGRFEVPLTANVAADGSIEIDAAPGDSIGDVVLFENRGGRLRYTVRRALAATSVLEPPALDREPASLHAELERLLVAHGLYPKEASAMVATWRDSWFEEGMRLFYILPQKTVDRILPLEIDPAPATVVRVFVGRIEIITRATQQAVSDAIREYDWAAIAKYGRFVRPIADRLLADSGPLDRPRLEQRFRAVYSRLGALAGCR